MGHAPIGAYQARFLHGFLFQQRDPKLWIRCPCGTFTQTRNHILIYCPLFHRRYVWSRRTGIDVDVSPTIDQLSQFIEDNPLAFSFEFHELWVQRHTDLRAWAQTGGRTPFVSAAADAFHNKVVLRTRQLDQLARDGDHQVVHPGDVFENLRGALDFGD